MKGPFEYLNSHLQKTEDAGLITPSERGIIVWGAILGITAGLTGSVGAADKFFKLGIFDKATDQTLSEIAIAGYSVAALSMISAVYFILRNNGGQNK
ncbi:MAG: hypothetical protein AAB955_02325 [Patescibacteria group bacterium]